MTDKERRDLLLGLRTKNQAEGGASQNGRTLNNRVASLPVLKPMLLSQISHTPKLQQSKLCQTSELDPKPAIPFLKQETLQPLTILPQPSTSIPTLQPPAKHLPKMIPGLVAPPPPLMQTSTPVKRSFKTSQPSATRFAKMTSHEQMTRFIH